MSKLLKITRIISVIYLVFVLLTILTYIGGNNFNLPGFPTDMASNWFFFGTLILSPIQFILGLITLFKHQFSILIVVSTLLSLLQILYVLVLINAAQGLM